jgi:hypothetical protein
VLEDGRVVADRPQRRPGRGAYVCDAACADAAARRRAFSRAFRRPAEVAEDFVESMS